MQAHCSECNDFIRHSQAKQVRLYDELERDEPLIHIIIITSE